MASLFISYRRADSEATAGRIVDHLARQFGSSAIFQDIVSLSGGNDFRLVIQKALDASEAVLVLIGKHWLAATDMAGRRRINNSDDFVRQEIEQALKAGKLVIPVLVDGATMPEADALPSSIRSIVNYQAVEIRSGRDFQTDMQRLITALEENTAALRAHPEASRQHQSAAMPLHLLIVSVFGFLALTSVGGGIYAIAAQSSAQTTLSILGAELRTEHVGVALVGIGFIITFLTVRSVLKSQHDLAKLPSDKS